MYEWVLVAMVLSPNSANIDYTVIDYYKSKQECMIVRMRQQDNKKNYICLPRDKG